MFGGYAICIQNAEAVASSQEIDIYYDQSSTGSVFDLGVAYALHKPLELLNKDEIIFNEEDMIDNIVKTWPHNKKVQSRNTDNPETDLLITIGDICILFEFKRTNEDCSAQLKQQAEIVKKNSQDSEPIKFIDLDWNKIIQTALSVLSIERQINNENIFLNNFIEFIEEYNPDWFPVKKLSAIPFPIEKDDYKDPNSKYLYNRLDYIKEFVFGEEHTKWVGDRYIISIDKPWAQELNVGYCNLSGEKFLTVEIYPGDTKRQGWAYFKQGKDYNWENEKICGYIVDASYYLKFSHFNSGITWLELSKDPNVPNKTRNLCKAIYMKMMGYQTYLCKYIA